MFRFAVAIFYVNETEILAITDHMKMFTFLRNMPSQLVDEEKFCQVRTLLQNFVSSTLFFLEVQGGPELYLELLVACYHQGISF
jgi:5-methylthioribose kinase